MTIRHAKTRSGRILWIAALVISGALAVAVFALEVGAIFPNLGMFSAIGAFVFPVLMPLSLVVAVPAVILGLIRRAFLTLAVGAVAVLTGIVMIVVFSSSVEQAGGSINVLRALVPSSITAAKADANDVYNTAGGQKLSVAIYQPSGPAKPWPTLFFIHGGGWNQGGNDQAKTDYRWYADHGWLVVSAEYRLSTPTEPTWAKAPGDVACALAWTASHAHDIGMDTSRLVLAGDSAGGNLAINLGYSAALGHARSNCGGTVPVPAAIVATYPAVDPTSVSKDTFSVGGQTIGSAVDEYLGGSPAQLPLRVRAITSTSYLSSTAPKTLVIEPEHDVLVPPAGVYSFVSAAQSAGVKIQLAKIPFANHTFDFYAAGTLGNQARLTITEHYIRSLVGSREK